MPKDSMKAPQRVRGAKPSGVQQGQTPIFWENLKFDLGKLQDVFGIYMGVS